MDRDHYSSYIREEANHEVARLQMILRNPAATQQERNIAQSMLGFYQDARIEETFARVMESQHSPHIGAKPRLRKNRSMISRAA